MLELVTVHDVTAAVKLPATGVAHNSAAMNAASDAARAIFVSFKKYVLVLKQRPIAKISAKFIEHLVLPNFLKKKLAKVRREIFKNSERYMAEATRAPTRQPLGNLVR